ncbi:MAG: selenocysteine-specific translation elongation factor [Gammaproteobacteria bacterium]|jgi:selenocysteine-specific elongation factor
MSESGVVSPQRRQLTLGVLGHVDHGKTALVRALTGIETDRLAEERERGLSIVPGYAWFESGSTCVDLIDAPGHQSFIRAMISAASGIDAALLVVAANEGVMPQTREHVAIAELLGIRTGLVVLTKRDLVNRAELEAAGHAIREYLGETFLRDAQILAVAAVDGSGIEELRDALVSLESQRIVDDAVPFLMPVDRSFTKTGFGRIATGTVHSGSVSTGDELVLVPSGSRVSVRGIQVHGQAVHQATQGDRAALNVRGSDIDSISRGTFLGHEHAALASARIDCLIEAVPAFVESFRNAATFRVLVGTAEAQAKLRILEHDVASEPRLLAQLRCDRRLPARRGMHFVLRSNSPAETVGGGIVIDPLAPRRHRFDRSGNRALLALARADHRSALVHYVRAAGVAGLEKEALLRHLSIDLQALDELIGTTDVVSLSAGTVCAAEVIEELAGEISNTLRHYHEQHPQHTGMRYAELRGSLTGEPHEALVQAACERLKSTHEIKASGDRWHLSSFEPTAGLSDVQRRLVARIEAAFSRSGVVSPSIEEIVGTSTAARESLRFLMDSGRVVRLQTRDRKQMLVLHASAIQGVREQISRRFPYPDEFAVKDVRDLLGTTRKHVVPLLEHLDATGFTLRRGDMRRIRQ